MENSNALGTFGTVNLYIYAGIYDGSSNASGSNAIWNGNTNASITLSNCSLYSSGNVFASTNNVNLASGQSMYYLSNNGVTQANGLVNRSGRTIVSSSTPSTDDFNWKLYTAYYLKLNIFIADDTMSSSGSETYTSSTNANFTVGDTTYSGGTTYTSSDVALTYYFASIDGQVNASWYSQYVKIVTTYNKSATVIVRCDADFMKFTTNWGIWDDGYKITSDCGKLTAKYYDKDGNLISTLTKDTCGNGTYTTDSWILSKGEYIVFEYMPPTDITTGALLKFDLQNITYEYFDDEDTSAE